MAPYLFGRAVTDDGRRDVIEEDGFADVLSLEEMLNDLHEWDSAEWAGKVAELRHLTDGLFEGLVH